MKKIIIYSSLISSYIFSMENDTQQSLTDNIHVLHAKTCQDLGLEDSFTNIKELKGLHWYKHEKKIIETQPNERIKIKNTLSYVLRSNYSDFNLECLLEIYKMIENTPHHNFSELRKNHTKTINIISLVFCDQIFEDSTYYDQNISFKINPTENPGKYMALKLEELEKLLTTNNPRLYSQEKRRDEEADNFLSYINFKKNLSEKEKLITFLNFIEAEAIPFPKEIKKEILQKIKERFPEQSHLSLILFLYRFFGRNI